MAMIGDRAQFHREGRVGPGLAFVISRFHKMEQMVRCPMARLDDRAPVVSPRDAVWIARSFRKHLEFPRSWMYPPHRTSEVMPLAVFGDDVALVKDAVQSVEPAVRPPGQRTGQFMEIGPSKSRQNHFPAHFLPILLAQKKQVR